MWLKDKNSGYYAKILSAIGILLSGYHYLLQINVIPTNASCSIKNSVSCATTPIFDFGYITIPLMAFTAFLLIFLIQIIQTNKKYRDEISI